MNIKVAAFTVSKKSSNTMEQYPIFCNSAVKQSQRRSRCVEIRYNLPRRQENESRRSESDNKKPEVQNPLRESIAGAQSGTGQAQIEMKKFMKEIR